MGALFNGLISILGSILAFFFDFLSGVFSDGVSYGLAIIGLTIVINILVFPLTLKQTRATRAFSALQPQDQEDPGRIQRRPPRDATSDDGGPKGSRGHPRRLSLAATGSDADLVCPVPASPEPPDRVITV